MKISKRHHRKLGIALLFDWITNGLQLNMSQLSKLRWVKYMKLGIVCHIWEMVENCKGVPDHTV